MSDKSIYIEIKARNDKVFIVFVDNISLVYRAQGVTYVEMNNGSKICTEESPDSILRRALYE